MVIQKYLILNCNTQNFVVKITTLPFAYSWKRDIGSQSVSQCSKVRIKCYRRQYCGCRSCLMMQQWDVLYQHYTLY